MTNLYVNYYVSNQKKADVLYEEMLLVSRQMVCKLINNLKLEVFKKWIKDNFNLQTKKVEVPLVLVKAINKKAELKSDNLASILPAVIKFKAYLILSKLINSLQSLRRSPVRPYPRATPLSPRFLVPHHLRCHLSAHYSVNLYSIIARMIDDSQTQLCYFQALNRSYRI